MVVWFDMDNTLVEKRNWEYWKKVGEGENMESYPEIPAVDNYSDLWNLKEEYREKGYLVGILTKVPEVAYKKGFNEFKIQWLEKNGFDFDIYRSVLTTNKDTAMKKGDILIDDDIRVQNRVREMGFQVINPKEIKTA